MAGASLSVVIVAHNSFGDLRHTLPALTAQLQPSDELIVVDNASTDGLAAGLKEIAATAKLVSMEANVGFAAGANAGAAVAGGEVLVLLNPDASVDDGWSEAIRAPLGGEWGAWMALVALDDGDRINTSGGVLHFTGLGWAGQLGQPVRSAPMTPVEVGFLSGACLAIPLQTWRSLGGFAAHFFMYCEDVDLSLRLRLTGAKIAVVPAARVRHRYEFHKGPFKWRLLERNRWATILRTYPRALLVCVAPALALTELAVWLLAMRQGWARMKALATFDVLRGLPSLRRERRAIQAVAQIKPAVFAAALTADLNSPFLGALGRSPAVRAVVGGYWCAVMAVLGVRS